MCICYTGERCPCYRNDREYQREQRRQAAASRIEHAVLDLLADPAAPVASPLAVRLADLIREHHDGDVLDVLVTNGGGIYVWTHGGEQHHARLDDLRAAAVAVPLRLVA